VSRTRLHETSNLKSRPSTGAAVQLAGHLWLVRGGQVKPSAIPQEGLLTSWVAAVRRRRGWGPRPV